MPRRWATISGRFHVDLGSPRRYAGDEWDLFWTCLGPALTPAISSTTIGRRYAYFRFRADRAARGGEDHRRGAGRSAGDDRHLRLRCRVVAATVRADDRVRAARASHDGAVAPARSDRGDHGVQFPRGGVGLERGARAGV